MGTMAWEVRRAWSRVYMGRTSFPTRGGLSRASPPSEVHCSLIDVMALVTVSCIAYHIILFACFTGANLLSSLAISTPTVSRTHFGCSLTMYF
ncbi:hypothetical protein BJV77DRAFT_1009660 [Russula vinacea]|nr:hypothetical protein BJV77DRAFT_1009660 [Russula vinacea]